MTDQARTTGDGDTGRRGKMAVTTGKDFTVWIGGKEVGKARLVIHSPDRRDLFLAEGDSFAGLTGSVSVSGTLNQPRYSSGPQQPGHYRELEGPRRGKQVLGSRTSRRR